MKAYYKKHILNFKRPSGTSRGVLTEKETWYLTIEKNGKIGIGECGVLRTLSVDDVPGYEDKLKWVCENIHLGKDELWEQLRDFPSLQFGVEQAFLSLQSEDPYVLFKSEFTKGVDAIPINGLVWMGEPEFMKSQIEEKIVQGFKCIKLKIGALDFVQELSLIAHIRAHFTPEEMEIRVDANGGFTPNDALIKMNQLAEFKLHSIEQPIKQKQTDIMSALCLQTPLPIALDEELIGVVNLEDKKALLQKVQPQYIILKPSLIGGFKGSMEWITLAEQLNIGWWITSALEGNIGLNAIAQFTFTLKSNMPQGLGTGSLYTNNIPSPLVVENGHLKYDPNLNWDLSLLEML